MNDVSNVMPLVKAVCVLIAFGGIVAAFGWLVQKIVDLICRVQP